MSQLWGKVVPLWVQRSTFGREQCGAMGGREAASWLANLWLGGPTDFIMPGNKCLGTKVASSVICGEGDRLFCPFPQRVRQCPPCCLGRQGADCKGSAWSKSTQHHWHDIGLHWPSHRLSCAWGCACTSCKPSPFAWISYLFSLQMFQLNYTNIYITSVRLFYLYGAQFSPLGPRCVCSHFMKPAPK